MLTEYSRQVVWIPARSLHINPDHQGALHPGTLRYLRAEWKGFVNGDRRCQGLPGHLTVTPEGEILDGLHRHTVAKEKHGDDVLLEAYVTEALTPAEKSARYLDLTRVHGRRPIDRYWNAVRAGVADPTYAAAAEVEHALNSMGLSVGENVNATSLACPAALLRVEARGGAALCASTAGLCRATWGDDPDRYDGRVIEGVARFLDLHPQIDRESFVTKLSKYRVATVIARARSMKVGGLSSEFGASMPALVAHQVRELYNKNRRTKLGEG
jgi:hypothetical protein